MAKGAPDYSKVVILTGLDDAGEQKTILLDTTGKLIAILQGQIGGVAKTVLTDTDGRIQAALYGMYGTIPTAVAVDEGGKLVVQNLAQTNIEGDLTEAQTYDSPVSNLLNNMNRIRYHIVAISGEAWGTISHSVATVWAKFHATTGHKHTGAADDAPIIAGTSVSNVPAGTIAATTIQAAINELDTEKGVVPAGLITMWHGLIANIPSGWLLCDGANGTPDLRSRFVRGAPAATEAGGTGGADTHTLSLAESPAHAHGSLYTGRVTGVSDGIPALTSYNGLSPWPWDPCVASAGSGNAHNNMPAYYQILFIMKS